MDNPPVNLARIAIGDGSIASGEVFQLLPVVSVLETYPQIVGYDIDVLEYFREQCVEKKMQCSGSIDLSFRASLCGYDLTLQYPQPEPFPTLTFVPGNKPVPSAAYSGKYGTKFTKRELMVEAQNRFAAKLAKRDVALSKRERIRAREAWKCGLADRANGTIDYWYGCDLYDEMLDYAINFTFPWCTTFLLRYFNHLLIIHLILALSKNSGGTFDVYNIPDALNPEAPLDASVFLNGLSLAMCQ